MLILADVYRQTILMHPVVPEVIILKITSVQDQTGSQQSQLPNVVIKTKSLS